MTCSFLRKRGPPLRTSTLGRLVDYRRHFLAAARLDPCGSGCPPLPRLGGPTASAQWGVLDPPRPFPLGGPIASARVGVLDTPTPLPALLVVFSKYLPRLHDGRSCTPAWQRRRRASENTSAGPSANISYLALAKMHDSLTLSQRCGWAASTMGPPGPDCQIWFSWCSFLGRPGLRRSGSPSPNPLPFTINATADTTSVWARAASCEQARTTTSQPFTARRQPRSEV